MVHVTRQISRTVLLAALILLLGAVSAGGAHRIARAAALDDGVVVRQGTFVDGEAGEHGSGTASITQDGAGSLTLQFENFSVSEGPELVVVLSPDGSPTKDSVSSIAALQVGQLKSRFGTQSYALPIGIDPADYRSVFVFCKQYQIVMTVATW